MIIVAQSPSYSSATFGTTKAMELRAFSQEKKSEKLTSTGIL